MTSLYRDEHPETSTKGTGFKNKEKALETLEIIKNFDIIKQKQIILTMYYRAYYHPNITKDIKKAMNIFKKWLIRNKVNLNNKKKK
jgi:hypothetical protein